MPTIPLDQIDNIRVASPCSMSWDDMEGDRGVRHCGECQMSVYNFADMTRDEIADLLGNSEGRVCGRFYRRSDGTIISRDCPVGVSRLRKRTAAMLLRVAAAVGALVTTAMVLAKSDANEKEAARLRTVQPFTRLANTLDPSNAPVAGGLMMGDIVCPTGGGQ